jgi:hypothetical protein
MKEVCNGGDKEVEKIFKFWRIYIVHRVYSVEAQRAYIDFCYN